MHKIDDKLVQQTAKLARLRLSDQQTGQMKRDLNEILNYVALLDELDLENIAPTAHPFMSQMRLRKDRADPFEDIDAIVDNGPETSNRLFKVPRIIAEQA